MVDRISLNDIEFAKLKDQWSFKNLTSFVLNPGAITFGDTDILGRGRLAQYANFPIEDWVELCFKSYPILFEQPFRYPIEQEEQFNHTVVFTTDNFFWNRKMSDFDIERFLRGLVSEEPYMDNLKIVYDNHTFKIKSVSI